jgi:hypothetical protein
MQISITSVPPSWSSHSGKSYETKFLYTGLGRIDTHSKMYQVFQQGTPFSLVERPFKGGVVSRVYSAELATVTEYSKSPRQWKEETPTGTQFFEELRRNS